MLTYFVCMHCLSTFTFSGNWFVCLFDGLLSRIRCQCFVKYIIVSIHHLVLKFIYWRHFCFVIPVFVSFFTVPAPTTTTVTTTTVDMNTVRFITLKSVPDINQYWGKLWNVYWINGSIWCGFRLTNDRVSTILNSILTSYLPQNIHYFIIRTLH